MPIFKTPVLTTPRLCLRPLTLEDAPRIQWLFPQWSVVQYMSAAKVPWPYPEDGAMHHLSTCILPEVAAKRRNAWALTLRDNNDNALIGVIELTHSSLTEHRGFWLGVPWHHRGLMTEASFAVNDFALFEMRMKELLFVSADANEAANRLKERSGAVRVQSGTFNFIAGSLPVSRWSLTQEAWEKNRETVWTHLAERAKIIKQYQTVRA